MPNLRYLNMIGAQLQKESQINQTMLYRRGAINEIKFNLDAKAASYINQAETSHANAKKDLTISLCVAGAAPILDNASFFSNEEIEAHNLSDASSLVASTLIGVEVAGTKGIGKDLGT